jgi:REP element-mobilizing transposase RayT
MPRQARLDFQGCFHHVINRGLDRREIFKDKGDYQNFIGSLERFVQEDGIHCYGWVLMPNHFHLVVKTGKTPLSQFMSRLQTSYVGQFNRRHKRSGTLFQNRFKSVVCDEDVYFKELIAYVHLNPLRAKMVNSLQQLAAYPWSGHRALIGIDKVPWQRVDDVLTQFGANVGTARRRYLNYLEEKKDVASGALSGGGLIRSQGGLEMVLRSRGQDAEEYDTRVLGGGDFVRRVEKASAPIHQPVQFKGSVPDLLKKVAEQESVPLHEIQHDGKTTARGSRARGLVAYLAVSFLGEKKNALADRFHVTPLAVTKLYRRGAQELGSKAVAYIEKLAK